MQHFDQWLLLVAVEMDVASFQSNACDTMWCFLKRLSILMGLKSFKKKNAFFMSTIDRGIMQKKNGKKAWQRWFGKRNSQKQRQTILECVV